MHYDRPDSSAMPSGNPKRVRIWLQPSANHVLRLITGSAYLLRCTAHYVHQWFRFACQFAKKECLAHCRRVKIEDRLSLALFHHDNQVSSANHLSC